jgi:cell division protein FtsW
MNQVKEWTDKHIKGDPVIWAVVLLLSIISILVVYSATGTLAFKRMSNPEAYLMKHTLLMGLGLSAMWLAHKVDYRYYSRLSRFALWISVPLLLYTYFNGVSLNDASRWIMIPVINASFQPSDLASLALITSLASMLAKRQQHIRDVKESLIPMLIWCGVICGLIALTNLSSAILLFLTCMLIMFIGRVPVKYLAMLVFVGAVAGVAAIQLGVRGETAKSRIESFINGDELPFQARHARIAVATGGIAGVGPGQSQQRNILPHPYSDFVYAIIIEEYGMIGGGIVLILYLILLFRGMRAVYESERVFGGLLSAGLSFAIVMQAMINMGVVVGLGPITGLPLPMVSMGGTSLLFTGLSLGIILSVSRGETDHSFSVYSKGSKNIQRAA